VERGVALAVQMRPHAALLPTVWMQATLA